MCQVAEDAKLIETTEVLDELRTAKVVDSRPSEGVEGLKLVNNVELNISKDFEDMKSKLNTMDSKLREVSFPYCRYRVHLGTKVIS